MLSLYFRNSIIRNYSINQAGREFKMSNTSNSDNASKTRPQVDPVQEFRFAVVMYGGVSLAIYINGITQELLELVQSTATDKDGFAYIPTEDLSASGKVYRKIGQLLGSKNTKLSDISSDTPISSRFVIDILSGTSAGGINAVFLAKALANDQEIEQLKKLWIEEGNLSKLINDSQSVNDDEMRKMGLKVEPGSLLNSQRMYLKLLKAFEEMDEKSNSENSSPYVDELDLFVTATNLRGQVIPIQLKDKTVAEKNHRHVFHFIFNQNDNNYKPRNDFSARFSPFLAFVARCTSSFPLAFEPMTLKDAEKVFKHRASYKKEHLDEWKELFFGTDINQSICEENSKQLDIEERAFGDGGYLDNKPFTYTTETLLRRRSNLPIKRHLIYIEPSPDHPENESQPNTKPNAIENSVSALITIPRNETIRQDIQQIINRNKIIRRIDRITDDTKIARDIEDFNNSHPQATVESATSKTGEDWKKKSLKDLIIERGISYGNYHRLKIATVTDELARLITRVLGFNYDDESAEFIAIRLFLREWRIDKYLESPTEQDKAQGKRTETEFLLNFDFDYRLRRLYFVRRKINNLYSKEDNKEVREEFKKIKGDLSRVINHLLLVKRALERSSRKEKVEADLNDTNSLDLNKIKEFSGLVKSIGIQRDFLKDILAGHTEEIQTKNVKKVLINYKDKLQKIAEVLTGIFKTCFDKTSHDCRITMDATANVKFFYDSYENYDMGIFPITYGTDVGEADEVEIIRISPEDATNLVDENETSQRKLKGTSFFAFGGFFDEEWRKNDILWGRLDGAERLISTLLPGDGYKEIRNALIKEAHQGIINKELEMPKKRDLLNNLLENIQSPKEKALSYLKSYFEDEEIQERFKNKNNINPELSIEILLGYLSRSTQVFGSILDDISKQKQTTSVVAPWLTRFGRTLWLLIEVASSRPNIFNIFIKYWLPLIYIFEIFLFVSGLLLQNQVIQGFGLQTLFITALVNLGVLWLKDVMKNQRNITRLIIHFIAFCTAVLITIGMRYLFKYGFGDILDDFNRFIQPWG